MRSELMEIHNLKNELELAYRHIGALERQLKLLTEDIGNWVTKTEISEERNKRLNSILDQLSESTKENDNTISNLMKENNRLEKENIELRKQIKELEENKFFIVNGHKKAIANLEKEKHILKITNDIFFDQIIELKARIDELEKQSCL